MGGEGRGSGRGGVEGVFLHLHFLFVYFFEVFCNLQSSVSVILPRDFCFARL